MVLSSGVVDTAPRSGPPAAPVLVAETMPVEPLVAVPVTALTATLEVVPVVPEVNVSLPPTTEATVEPYW